MIIHLHDMVLHTSLGVYSWEKARPRPVTVQCWLEVDAGRAAQADALENTVDYAAVEQALAQAAKEKHYQLVEALMSALAQAALTFEGVSSVTLEVTKPGALHYGKSVTLQHSYYPGQEVG